MMKIAKKIVFYLILLCSPLFLSYCTEIVSNNGIVASRAISISAVPGAVELSDGLKLQMNGIYSNSNNTSFLAEAPIIYWTNDLMNIYTSDNYTTYALKGGIRNDSLIFKGISLDGAGKISVEAGFSSAGEIGAKLSTGKISFKCYFYSNNNVLEKKTTISFNRKISKNLSGYTIIVHDGGGNDAYSSNSLGGIRHSGLTGANGMEIDISLSRDGIPFCFHDPEFKSDNINSDFCTGPVTNFSMEDIKILALLPDGSRVPTLNEALNTIVNETYVKTVWLDIKNAKAISACIPIIEKFKARAASLNKTIEIFVGLPSQEAIDEFIAIEEAIRPLVLTELPPDIVQQINADVWGPQWDNTINSPDQISFVHSLGKRVFCWTIDDPGFYAQFSGATVPDGIITNDCQKMIYEYLIQNN
jgi:glycerophosphoryl diester phosphodiesterase